MKSSPQPIKKGGDDEDVPLASKSVSSSTSSSNVSLKSPPLKPSSPVVMSSSRKSPKSSLGNRVHSPTPYSPVQENDSLALGDVLHELEEAQAEFDRRDAEYRGVSLSVFFLSLSLSFSFFSLFLSSLFDS